MATEGWRSRLPSTASSSSQVPSRKVCLFCHGESEQFGWEYIIFIFDLESGDDKITEISRIQINMECFSSATFCVIGSTLFAFEGFTRMFGEENPDRRLIVFKYDLSSLENIKCKLDRSMFVKAGELKDSKKYPFATVLNDGKILVFSTTIRIERYWDQNCDFEIFDPVEGVSHELPKLCPSDSFLGLRRTFHIESHAIVESSVESSLVLKTDFGICILNLKPPHKNKSWRFNAFAGASQIPSHTGSSFVVIQKKICVVEYYAYDIVGLKKNENAFRRWLYKFPDLSSLPDEGFIHGGSTIFENEDDTRLCFLKLGIDSDTGHPRMVFDVYQLDLKECEKGLAAIRKNKRKDGTGRELILLPGATKLLSVEYSDFVAKFTTFRMRHFSYIRTE